MSRFIAENGDFVPAGESLPLLTVKRLLNKLGVSDKSHAVQVAAVQDWLGTNEAGPVLKRGLASAGLIPPEESESSGLVPELARLRRRARRQAAREPGAVFGQLETNIADNADLRDPQRQGYAAVRDYFASGGNHAVLEIPVGGGKTGLIAILPFRLSTGRVLVIAPNLTIRDQLAAALDITSPNSFYRQAGVLSDLSRGPYRAVLDSEANISDCYEADLVVTNIHQLAARIDRWLPNFANDFFDLIIVDEGHHNAAPSWKNVFSKFSTAKIVSVTATPFRADGQEVEGDHIYRYTFRKAMLKGYIKQLSATNVAPIEIYFTYKGEDRHHSLEEVLDLREEDWFSKGVALARECNISIADASIQWMQHLRLTGTPHQIVASACSLDHSREVRGIYEERGLRASEIHSQQSVEHREQVLRDLRANRLDAIVQVQMLGEGFDHPLLSVAAIFRPYRSLSPYIQFVGRAMRVNVQNAPGHPDNTGVVVSHVGLNIDRLWHDFKSLDTDDRELVSAWVSAGEVNPEEASSSERRRLGTDMQVTLEVLDRFVSDPYIDPADEALIENAINSLREQGLDLVALGLDEDELRRRILEAKGSSGPEAPIRLPVQPQARRQVLRTRLNEQTKSAASRILQALDQSLNGQQIAIRSRTGAANNLGAAIALLHREVNAFLKIDRRERRDLTTEELERAIDALDDIADGLQEQLRSWMS